MIPKKQKINNRDLSNNNLGGKIVAELANLINLQHL